MTLFEQATQAMQSLVDETKDMSTGRQPSAPKVIELLTKLCQIHMLLAEERATQYNKWREAELKRKRVSAEKFKENRQTEKSIKDTETKTFIDCWNEHALEAKADTAYKNLTIFYDAVGSAIDTARTIQSYVRSSESSQ